MSEEIGKIINDSISAVLEGEKTSIGLHLKHAGTDVERAAIDTKNEAVKASKKLVKGVGDTATDTKNVVVGAGKKFAKGTSDTASDLQNYLATTGKKAISTMKDHGPALGLASAAGLAAAVGGLAAIKKMRKAAKKK